MTRAVSSRSSSGWVVAQRHSVGVAQRPLRHLGGRRLPTPGSDSRRAQAWAAGRDDQPFQRGGPPRTMTTVCPRRGSTLARCEFPGRDVPPNLCRGRHPHPGRRRAGRRRAVLGTRGRAPSPKRISAGTRCSMIAGGGSTPRALVRCGPGVGAAPAAVRRGTVGCRRHEIRRVVVEPSSAGSSSEKFLGAAAPRLAPNGVGGRAL